MISNDKLDDVRYSLINNWPHEAFFIWHREYKDYDDIQCSYAGKKVIVVQFKGRTSYNNGPKIGCIPFIYRGVPIKLWK